MSVKWQLPDPNGETYEDGSCDTLIEVEYPSVYPTDHSRIDVYLGGADVGWNAEQIRWFVEHAPQFLAHLEARSGVRDLQSPLERQPQSAPQKREKA